MFSRLGLLRFVEPKDCTEETLREEVAAALVLPRQELLERTAENLDCNGAHAAAQHLLELAERNEMTSNQPQRSEPVFA